MKYLILLSFLFPCSFLEAQEVAIDPADLELDGLVFDQTRTRIGRELYELFFGDWNPPEDVSGYSILVEEQPALGRFGIIEIKVNDQVVVSANLQPGVEWMEEAVKQIVERLTDHLQNMGQMQQDLDDGDQAGSGIY